MRIVILAMDDPLYTNDFIRHVIDKRREDIVAYLHVKKGSRLTTGQSTSKFDYLVSLFLIMGPAYFVVNSSITLCHKLKKLLSWINIVSDPTIYNYAKERGIEVLEVENPNSEECYQRLKELKPDIILNQSQAIIKRRLIDIPSIGVINRHNALLPKNRGRLTPFWVLYKGEEETGVSIHFVEEALDSGDIIVQRKFPVAPHETFNSLVKKNYLHAKKAIIKALELLENRDYGTIENDDKKATYNTLPTVKQAWEYRKRRITRWISR